jgi:Cu+-exporting ATPase
MIEALLRAEESQAPVQKLADRLAGYLVYFALACALVTLLITHNARSTIAVIIVAGACGIAAGTPLAILGALGRAARLGAVVKGGSWMEKLATVDTVVFDKTGTLTLGKPEVVELDAAPGVSPTELLRIAASAEAYSEHLSRGPLNERRRGWSFPRRGSRLSSGQRRDLSPVPASAARKNVCDSSALQKPGCWQ